MIALRIDDGLRPVTEIKSSARSGIIAKRSQHHRSAAPS
jgi:hypothetical protein